MPSRQDAPLLTYAELAAMPQDGYRYELVEGVPVVVPAPTGPHQVAVTRLARALQAPAGYHVLVAPIDWVLHPHLSRQPDLVVVTEAQAAAAYLSEPPLLVVEVLSPDSQDRDLVTKRSEYAAAGGPHYWALDPEVPSLLVLELRGGEYAEVALVRGTDPWETDHPFPVRLVPADLCL